MVATARVVPRPSGWMAGSRARRRPDPQDVEIGRRLRAAREARRRTQLELAVELGVRESTYGRRETGEIPVRSAELDRIARFLDVSVASLMPGGPEPPRPAPRDPRAILRELEDLLEARAPADPRIDAMVEMLGRLPPEEVEQIKREWEQDLARRLARDPPG